MVVVGADVHKRTHTFVAVDDVGRKVGEKVVSATTPGHGEAVIEAGVGGGESGHFVERDDAAVECLREKTIGERLATVAGELAVDLVDHEGGDDDGSLVLQVVGEQWGLGVFGEIFEPA